MESHKHIKQYLVRYKLKNKKATIFVQQGNMESYGQFYKRLIDGIVSLQNNGAEILDMVDSAFVED